MGTFHCDDKKELVEAAGDALYGTMIAAYAQGFWLMAEASAAKSEDMAGDYNFTLQLDEIARIWRGG